MPDESALRHEELTIERMAYGADAVAHAADGKAVFVSGGVPGDVARVAIIQDGTSFSKGRVERVLAPSPDRVEPPCPLCTVCGGCPWGSLSYSVQLAAKRANVVDALARIGRLPAKEAERLVGPCAVAGDPWGYRNKVELAFARRGGRALVGMHGAGGQGVIKVDRCPLLDKRYERMTKSVAGAVSYLANSHALDIERIGIRASRRTGEVEVALWTEPGPFPRAQVAKVLGDACRTTSVVRVLTKGPQKARRVTGVERLAGRGHWGEFVGSERMSVSAPSFFQVNTRGAERLVSLVLEGLRPTEDDGVMDLYCGTGTFTLPLARRCAWVSAVESYGPAVRDLRHNLDVARLDNVDAQGGDADREFPQSDADVIVVDPPRAGLGGAVVDKLSAQDARAIAYVSCDPATLARDLARFRERAAFAIESVVPVDLFPQTFHVETVTILRHV